MTTFNSQNYTDGSQSVIVTWALDDTRDSDTGNDNSISVSPRPDETMPNGDPSCVVLWGNEE